MRRYPIAKEPPYDQRPNPYDDLRAGFRIGYDRPNSDDDLRAGFRIGYDPDRGYLYLAVEVEDDSLVVKSGRDTDLCEVYLNGNHSGSGQPEQYVFSPGQVHPYYLSTNPALAHEDISQSHVEAAFTRQGNRTTYEWAIEVFDAYPTQKAALRPGRTIGFDIAVADRDPDETGSLVSWGPKVNKYRYAALLGDLILGESGSEIGSLAGRITDQRTGMPIRAAQVEAVRKNQPILAASTDSSGHFCLNLFSGRYTVRAFARGSRETVILKGVEISERHERQVDLSLEDRGTCFLVDGDAPRSGDGGPAHPFRMVQDALSATSAGDTVKISAGWYPEPIDGVPDVTLLGVGPNPVRIAVRKSLPSEEPYIKRTTCYRVAEPITVDGRLDEKSWSSAVPLGLFPAFDAGPFSYQTISRMLWDEQYLYLSFECEDPHIEVKRGSETMYDLGDMVRIGIMEDGDYKGLELGGTPLGVVSSWKYQGLQDNPGVYPSTSEWKVKGVLTGVQIHGRGWTVEWAIPWRAWALLSGDWQGPPREGDILGINLLRGLLGQNEGEETSLEWSPTPPPWRSRLEARWGSRYETRFGYDKFGAVFFSREAITKERAVLSLEKTKLWIVEPVALIGKAQEGSDGLPDPGETIEVGVTIKNYSQLVADHIVATLRSGHPEAVVVDSLLEIGTIPPREEVSSGRFKVQIGAGYLAQTPLPMLLHLRDSVGHQWTENLDLYLDAVAVRALDQRDVKRGTRLGFADLPWVSHFSDDIAWADPEFDDTSWYSCQALPQASRGTTWVRAHVLVNATLWDKPLILEVGQKRIPRDIYLDGRLIYGGVESREGGGDWERTSKVFLLNKKSHVFAMRYSADPGLIVHGNTVEYEYLYPPELKEATQGIGEKKAELRGSGYLMFFAGIPLAFAMLHFVLFLFYRRARQNLYYAIFIGFVAAYILIATQIEFFSTNIELYALYEKYGKVVPLILALALLRFLYSLFYTRMPRLFWGFLLLGLGTTAGAIYAGYPYRIAYIPIAAILETLRVISLAIYRKKPGAKIIGGGIAFSVVVIGLVIATTHLKESGEGGEGDVEGGNVEVRSSVIWVCGGLMGLLVSMSIHLGRTSAQINTSLEARLVQVEELSAKNLEQERALRAEAEKELQTAHEMQMALMPKEPPRIAGFEITGRCMPANHVGGDLFQYFHQHDRLSISLADVTGHAMAAAIPVVMFSGILKSQMEMGGSVEELFRRLNRSLHGTLTGRTFVCFALGELDPGSRLFRFSDAGCPYPYHYRAATGEVVELQVDAYPLGIRPDTSYRAIEIQLEPGDRVVFCSDGIIEATNEAGEMFSFERTGEVVRKGCQDDLSAEGLLARVIQEVKAFSGEVPQGDDQTVVVLKVDDRRST